MVDNILVTGGAGYIGTVLVHKLLNKGYKVNVADLLIYGDENLQEHPNLKVYKIDIRDKDIKRLIEEADVVFHLAGVSNDPGQGLEPKTGRDINYLCTERIVSYCETLNVKRLIYPSSCSVYGKSDLNIVNEQSIVNPLTEYAICKVLSEETILRNSNSSLVRTIIRPATVYGVSPRQRFDLMVNSFVNEAYNLNLIKVKGPNRIRPSIHIDDLVSLYLKLLDTPASIIDKQIFNAAYENYSVMKKAQIIAELVSEKVQIEILDGEDQRTYKVDTSKLTSLIGFRPRWNIVKGSHELLYEFYNGKYADSFTNSKYYNKLRQPQYL